MACQLYTENDLVALYGVIYGNILDRINDPKLGKFDKKAFDGLIKEVYDELKDDPEDALIYAQAIPDIFNLVANDPQIAKYLIKDVDFDFNYPKRLSLDFEDLKMVQKFVAPKKRTVTKTADQIKKEVKKKNKGQNNVVQNNDNNKKGGWSAVEEEDKSKIDYPDKTSGQISVAKNPKNMSEAERNEEDPQKKMFYEVIKTVVWAARHRGSNAEVMLGDKPVVLKVQRLQDIPAEDLTNYDSSFLASNKGYNILAAIVADENGDPIRFDEDGNIVEEGGRIVYQYLRTVVKDDNKLYLGNRSGYRYSLVPALTLAKREIAEKMEDGELLDETQQKAILSRIKRDQKQKINDLARLQERMEKDATPVLLPITGGSYGIVEHKSALLSETPFADAVDMVYVQPSGYSFFIASKNTSGVAIDGKIFLQRMDVTEDLARNIAKILTTDLLKDGEPLTAQEKLNYYQTFLSNRVAKNNMTVDIEDVLGEERLLITLTDPTEKDPDKKTINPLDDPDTAEEVIFNHLMTANKKEGFEPFPATMSYMNEFVIAGVIQKGSKFLDYEFTKNKSGQEIIKGVSKDYFTFIKPMMKVDFTAEDQTSKYFTGINAYLSFAIPDEFSTPESEQVAVGIPSKEDITDKGVKNGDETKKRTTRKATKEEKTEGKIQYFSSTLADNKLVKKNVDDANITLGLGVDFSTKDEKAAEYEAGRKKTWYGLKIGTKKSAPKNFMPDERTIDKIVENLVAASAVGGGSVINIVGNDIAALADKGFTQADIDKYIYNILEKVNEKFPISKVIGTGQTGISEAAIKAAIKLDIPVMIRAFSNFRLRYPAPYLKTGYRSEKNSKSDFMKRFFGKGSKNLLDAEVGTSEEGPKPSTPKRKSKARAFENADLTLLTSDYEAPEVPKDESVEKKDAAEQKEVDKKIVKTKLDDLLKDSTDLFSAPERNKAKAGLMDQLYADKKKWAEVEKWWDKSPLKNIVSLERFATVVNSDAFGRFMTAGYVLSTTGNNIREKGFAAKIELYGDAAPITLYHEAWHAFSQLVLSLDDKIKLYEAARSYPKWKDLEYIDIEEQLAEEYIDYAVNGKKQQGFIQKIFEKIKAIVDYFFGKTGPKDITRLQDIPKVKEYFDQLYTGKFTVNLDKAESNVMKKFQLLNSSKNIIQPLKKEAKSFSPFTEVESDKLVNLIDSLMARQFYKFNSRYNTTSGAAMLLSEMNNRVKLYEDIERDLKVLEQDQIQQLEEIVQSNLNSDTPDVIGEQKAQARVELLLKALTNFGDIRLALSGKMKSGVVAFHMEKSRFAILNKSYKEELEDATTQLFVSKEGNTYSAKDLASIDTMMTLSGIYELKKDKDGRYLTETDEDGVESYISVTDEFGAPSLVSVDVMWSRLARILQGSLDYEDIYDRISRNVNNYPEFLQVLDMLPDPSTLTYNSKTEFKTETQFWQDFKKPVIPYIQFNINKTVESKAVYVENKKVKPAIITYESRVAAANFDIYKILNDWASNFSIADPTVNPYIRRDELQQNFLNIEKLMKDVSSKRQLIPEKANDFLRALGIVLDTGSADIRNIIENKKKPFVESYNIDQIYNTMRLVYLASKHEDEGLQAAAQQVLKRPLFYLLNGLPKKIEDAAGGKPTDVRSKIRVLAEQQNRFSDGYSNFSVLTPEKNKVWEQFLDNTLTRSITSINLAKNWQELTGYEDEEGNKADPNGRFQHMYWLAEENNPGSQFSVILNSIFDLDPMSSTYGEKLPGAKLLLENIAGSQVIDKEADTSVGSSTASTDVTSKFLQELHTMLLSGVQEFMRHASKQTAMNMRVSEIQSKSKKANKHLYVDVMAFSPSKTSGNNNLGESEAFNIILGYIAAEAGRIFRYKSNKEEFGKWAGYNRKVVRKDNKKTVDAGEAFTAFDDVLTPELQGELYKIIDDNIGNVSFTDFDLKEIVNQDTSLRQKLKADVIDYFNKQAAKNYDRLQGAKYVDPSLYELVVSDQLSKDQVDKILIKAYTYNSWIHNYETIILAYGDMAQYNHDKEEFHKRNAGLGAGGRGFRADFRSRAYINSSAFTRRLTEKEGTVKPYDGTLTSAILSEQVIEESKYYKEYREMHVEEYTKRYLRAGKSKTEAKKLAENLADKVLKDYKGMKYGDGQGWVTLDSYKMLKTLENKWTPVQEKLYNDILDGVEVSVGDIIEYFPPYKVQHYGHIKTKGLGLVSFHKFSLAPIIPTVATENTNLGKLHKMMMQQGIDYALMPTGSKVGHIGSGDNIFDSNGEIDTSVQFTKNVIFVENLKNQTEINSEYKGLSIFSTQLRKMVLEGLYEQGQVSPEAKVLAENYIKRVSEYTDLLKNELLDEIGFAKDENGEYVATDKDSLAKLAKLIRDNLTRDDVLSDKLIDIIDVTEDGELRFDLSLHPEAAKIEKLLLSLINKRIIKQKVKGEPLVQVSSALYEGLFEMNFEKGKASRDAAIKKYMGSNFLPTYHKGEDGKTRAMKVAIALQGDYEYLLNLEYKGEPIETIDRLNEAIKDDEWLDANDGANRKAITMVGVRIPVQGLNSMEFMEVYHFLPAEAGNIIIPPAEIVAKSGADFDIDKLSIFMNNLTAEGTVVSRMFDDPQAFYDALKNPEQYGMTKAQMYAMQKAGYENLLIDDIRGILELPQNYVSLTTPNGTFLVKPLADKLSQYVMEYNPFENMMTDEENLSAPNKKGEQNRVISPTRVLEVGYNLYKHESNVVGKRTLGLGAIENTFNVIFNSLGAYMPPVYHHGPEGIFSKDIRESFLGLRHNTTIKEGQEVISLAHQFDVDGLNKVADIINQMMNGWVDVEKDAWIFFIQGNYEVAPILLYLLKAGVPVTEAVYFVSQPLVREYVKEKRLSQSTFAEPLRRQVFTGVNYDAATRVMTKYFGKAVDSDAGRYIVGKKMYDDFFEKRSTKHFTEQEMLKLIEKSSSDMSEASSKLSQTMFMHFLTIEQQIQGITELKMASNPDTSLMTDIGQALSARARWEALVGQTKIPQSLRQAMIDDSIISSFFNYDLIEGLSKPLFRFRYDEDIQIAIESIRDFGSSRALKAAFGKDYKDKFPVVLRNDILSYLFQNALRRYKIGKDYSSFVLDENVDIRSGAALDYGVQFVETADGFKMFVDNIQLEREFFQKAYLKGSDQKNSYEDRGLYPLSSGVFGSTSVASKEQYVRFVIEREYLRHIYPIEQISNTEEFKAEYEMASDQKIKNTDAANKRYAYEKILAGRALDNVLNPYHLFNDKEQAYAVRLERLKLKYADGFVKDYPVLSRLKLDSNSAKDMFSLYLDDKDLDSYKSNLYTANLAQLADRTVKKVDDIDENNAISDFFSKMTYVAMMQAGTNKTKFNFLNITDFEKFIDIMSDEVAKFVNSPAKVAIITDFMQRFYIANSVENMSRSRFKDYITKLDVEEIESTAQRSGRKTYSGKVTSLKPNQIFAFGSNPLGINGNPEKGTGGAALVAYKIAGVNQGEIMDNRLSDSGKAWGITTVTAPGKKKSKTPKQITDGIKKLYAYASANPTKEILVADYSATNLNGYSGQEMADMFVAAGPIPSNIVFNENFDKLVATDSIVLAQGVEISSNAKGLAAALTNPTELAKSKGNLSESYPIEYRGKVYKDSEAAYQALKSTATKDNGPNSTYNLMVDILKAKLQQYPELVEGIAEQGGSPWILSSTHQPTKQNTVWETGGKNWFIKALNEAYAIVQENVEKDITSENLAKRKNLLPTNNPNVFVYNDLSGSTKAYEYAVKNNPDITFVYGFTIAQMQTFSKMSPKEFEKAKLSGQVELKRIAGNSSIGLIVSQDKIDDSFSKTEDKYYTAIKNLIENQIQQIVQAIADGNKVAFSINGYGDPKKMPKEIFDYLSKRLFEEFQYLNPGSGIVQEVAREVAKYQPITDAEILAKFEGDNNPLKC